MERDQRGVKRCFVDEFLDEQRRKIAKTKTSTRMEHARAVNRQERACQNMMKAKESAKKAMEIFRENEAAYEAACEEEARLRKQLEEDPMEEGAI